MGSTYTIEPPDTQGASGFTIEPPDAPKDRLAPLGPNAKPIQMSGTSPVAQAYNDLKQGNYAKAAHGLISSAGAALSPLAVPAAIEAPFAFIGSLVSGASGQYAVHRTAKALGASDDTADLAGDIGSLAASYGGYKASEAIASRANALRGKVSTLSPAAAATPRPAGALQPAINNSPAEVLNYAAQKGINLTPGEALQSPIAQTAQAIGERSLAKGGDIANAREVSNAKFIENLQDFTKRNDPHGLGVSEEDAGRAVQQSIRIAQDISHDNASNSYKQLPQRLMDAPVDVSNINQQYFQAMKNAQTSLANRNPQMAAQIQQVYDQFSNLGTPAQTSTGAPYKKPQVDFQTLLKMRSDALQDGNALAKAGAPDEVQGMYRKISAQLDSLAEQTANKFGALKDWREANAGWREYQTKYNDPTSPLYQAAKQTDPAKITQSILNRGSASDIELLKSEHMEPAIEAIRRQAITDIANRGFRVQGDGLGGYSDTFLNSLFGPKGTKELYLNGELARRMKFQLNPSGTSNVMLGLEQATNPKALVGSALFGKAAMPRPAGSYLPTKAAVRPSSPASAALSGLGLRAMLESDDKR